MKKIGVFITPHGFGHATRAIAVLQALQERLPLLKVEIFSTLPEHLFRQSLGNYVYHHRLCDIGLVQRDAMHADLKATAAGLAGLLPPRGELLDDLGRQLEGCECVLCDISFLGIAAANAAGIPSVLVENFTWDWVYRSYRSSCPALAEHAEELSRIDSLATYRVQAEPVCAPYPQGDLQCHPIFRTVRRSPLEVRNSLAAGDRRLVLISMGGVPFSLFDKALFAPFPDCFFVLAGQQKTGRILDNCITLAYDSLYYHPDLIGATDLVICKSGYSTVADCWQAGTRIGCIERNRFPESETLSHFVRTRMNGTILPEDIFSAPVWQVALPAMLKGKRPAKAEINGADQVADFLLAISARR